MSQGIGTNVALLDFSAPRSTAGGDHLCFEQAPDGRRFLDVFLERVLRVDHVDAFLVLLHPSMHPRLAPWLRALPILKPLNLPADVPAFLPRHELAVQGRKWAHQGIKGGALDTTWYDETLPLNALQIIARQFPSVRTILHLHPEMPLFSVAYANQLLEVELVEHADGGAPPPMLVRHAPLGLSPTLLTRRGVDLLRQGTVWSPAQFFRFFIDLDGLVRMDVYVKNNAGSDLRRAPLLLRTRRDLSFLRAILATDDGARLDDADDLAAALDARPELLLDDRPREVDVELSSAPYPPRCRLPALPPLGDMAPDLLRRICAEVRAWDDGLLTLGDLGDLLRHPRLPEIRQILTAERPYGLHAVWNAETLLAMPEPPLDWLDAGLDVLTLRLTPLSYSPRFTMADAEPLLERLAARAKAAPNGPLIHLELHKHGENWRDFHRILAWQERFLASANLVPHDDYAGQMPALADVPVYVPRRRYACEKARFQLYVLPDGTVPQCKMDVRASRRMGDAARQSLSDIWNGEPLRSLRTAQVRGDFRGASGLCGTCSRWFHT